MSNNTNQICPVCRKRECGHLIRRPDLAPRMTRDEIRQRILLGTAGHQHIARAGIARFTADVLALVGKR